MFAVFNNNKFVNFWLNGNDQEWLNLTIASQGWKSEDVVVVFFEKVPSPVESYFFNEQKEIVILVTSQTEVNGEMKSVHTPGQIITGKVYYENGQFK